jgi:hypothetical protein
VGVMVLDRNPQLGCRKRSLGVPGAEIARVQVVGDPFWLSTEQMPVELDGRLKVLEGFEVLHVSDVLAHEGEIVARDAKSVLQFRPGCQDLPSLEG